MEQALWHRGIIGLSVAGIALAGCSSTPPPSGRDIVWESERVDPQESRAALPPAAPTPGTPAASPDGCREYTQTVIIDGKEQQAYGRACPQPDGSWRVNQPAKLPSLPGPPARVVTYPTYYPAYYPPVFFSSAFFFQHHHRHRHHHHRHHHRRFR